MDKFTKRKLNLLIYLAKIDGKFHKSEKALLKEFVNEEEFDVTDFRLLEPVDEKIGDLYFIDDKQEMLFLAIKLMQADKVIDKREMAFCKEIAVKLGFNASVIDEYASKVLDRKSFDETINDWVR